MNCSSCGLQLPEGAKHCPRCGTTTPYNYSTGGTAPDDATYISTPYAAAPPVPPTQYAAPYEMTPPTQLATTPYEAAPQAPSSSPPYGTVPPTQYAATPYEAPPTAPAVPPPYGVAPQDPYSASPYNPYAAVPPPPTPVPPTPVKRSGNRTGIIIGIVILLLILIGGVVFGVLQYSAARSAANAAMATATAHANATATASAIAATRDPYTHNGTLVFSDPLSDNSMGHGWSQDAPNCVFTGGAYHAIAPDANFPDYCLAGASNFSNFVIEAQMQIIKGDAGGFVFRVEDTNPNKLYAFYIGQDGSYNLNLQNPTGFPLLANGTNPAIKKGLNQTNLIAVVAQGSSIMLYVNHTLIKTVTDSTYTGGQIGTFVAPYTKPSEAVFTNLKVWKL